MYSLEEIIKMNNQKMCKYWHEADYGGGLKEICKLTDREVSCCADIKECEFNKIREEKENTEVKSD